MNWQTLEVAEGRDFQDSLFQETTESRRLPPVMRDPQAERFQATVEQKLKEFRTLKQLHQTLSKQVPLL